ncbi:MAG: glycosyltransferase [Bacteroidetes bacterium]|nr:glycosyltransferase [Bacteroidota bacterium]
MFIELFANLKQEFPKLTGKIIGDGIQLQELQALINDLKLQKSLILTGKLPRDAVMKEMQKCKILLHTSSYESGGYVFLEALYSGMKVVCFKVGLLPEVQGAYSCDNEKEIYSNLKSLLTYKQEYSRKTVPFISDSAKAIFDLYKSA